MNKKICYALLGILCSSIETGFCSSNTSGGNLLQQSILSGINECNKMVQDFLANYSSDQDTKTGDYDDSNVEPIILAYEKYEGINSKYKNLVSLSSDAIQHAKDSDIKLNANNIQRPLKRLSESVKLCKKTYDAFKSKVMKGFYQQCVQNSHNENAKKSEYEHIQSLINFINQEYLECDDNAIKNNNTSAALKRLVNLQQSLYPFLIYIRNAMNNLTPEQQKQLCNGVCKGHELDKKFEDFTSLLKNFNDNQLKNISLLFNQIVLMISKPSKNINDIYQFTQDNILKNVKNTYNITNYFCALIDKEVEVVEDNDYYDNILLVILNGLVCNPDNYLKHLNSEVVITSYCDTYGVDKQQIKTKIIAPIENVINDVKTKPIFPAFDMLVSLMLILQDNRNN